MVGNQVFAVAVGFVPVAGDFASAIFKPNSRNAALLEEYLRVRGEEFLKTQTDRVEDPRVVKPGAGRERAEKVEGISGDAPSQSRLGLFRRSSKKVPTTGPTPSEDEDALNEKDGNKSDRKGKGRKK